MMLVGRVIACPKVVGPSPPKRKVGWGAGTVFHQPLSFVTTVRTKPVSVCVIVTFAFGIAAPVESVMVPNSVAVLS